MSWWHEEGPSVRGLATKPRCTGEGPTASFYLGGGRACTRPRPSRRENICLRGVLCGTRGTPRMPSGRSPHRTSRSDARSGLSTTTSMRWCCNAGLGPVHSGHVASGWPSLRGSRRLVRRGQRSAGSECRWSVRRTRRPVPLGSCPSSGARARRWWGRARGVAGRSGRGRPADIAEPVRQTAQESPDRSGP